MVSKPLPPPSGKKATTNAVGSDKKFSLQSGKISGSQRVIIYGTGGIGKTSLAALVPNPVFLDIEGGTNEFDVPRISGIESFADLRASLQSGILDDFDSIVIDSATKVEEWAIAHTIENVKNEKGNHVTSIEGYGFGKGLQHTYDTFLLFLADLDAQIRKGRNVILIAHNCIDEVPNPLGDNFIRNEPHLQSPRSGKASIRNRVVQWADHVLFIGYDIIVEDGKARGSGTRTIWPTERPDHVAKSRLISDSMPFTSSTDGAIWSSILGGSK